MNRVRRIHKDPPKGYVRPEGIDTIRVRPVRDRRVWLWVSVDVCPGGKRHYHGAGDGPEPIPLGPDDQWFGHCSWGSGMVRLMLAEDGEQAS